MDFEKSQIHKMKRYHKVESAYQCCQRGANSPGSFAEHPNFKNSGNIDRPISLYDNVFGSRLIPADLLAHPCGFWVLASPLKRDTNNTPVTSNNLWFKCHGRFRQNFFSRVGQRSAFPHHLRSYQHLDRFMFSFIDVLWGQSRSIC